MRRGSCCGCGVPSALDAVSIAEGVPITGIAEACQQQRRHRALPATAGSSLRALVSTAAYALMPCPLIGSMAIRRSSTTRNILRLSTRRAGWSGGCCRRAARSWPSWRRWWTASSRRGPFIDVGEAKALAGGMRPGRLGQLWSTRRRAQQHTRVPSRLPSRPPQAQRGQGDKRAEAERLRREVRAALEEDKAHVSGRRGRAGWVRGGLAVPREGGWQCWGGRGVWREGGWLLLDSRAAGGRCCAAAVAARVRAACWRAPLHALLQGTARVLAPGSLRLALPPCLPPAAPLCRGR